MQPMISQVCTLSAAFDEDVRDYASAHCAAAEVWLTKLETFLERSSVAEVRRLVDEAELALPAASYQGGLLESQGERRAEAWRLFDRRLQICHELGIRVIVVACDVAGPVTGELLGRVKVSLADMARRAEGYDMKVALEFQSKSAVGSNLQTAVALVEEINSHALGVCVDLFHFWVGSSKTEDLALLTPDNLMHVQLCDLVDVPREWATDADRILPGDGDLPLAPLVERLREMGYERGVAVETMNPQFWQVPTLQFAEIAVTAVRRVLGMNEPT